MNSYSNNYSNFPNCKMTLTEHSVFSCAAFWCVVFSCAYQKSTQRCKQIQHERHTQTQTRILLCIDACDGIPNCSCVEMHIFRAVVSAAQIRIHCCIAARKHANACRKGHSMLNVHTSITCRMCAYAYLLHRTNVHNFLH